MLDRMLEPKISFDQFVLLLCVFVFYLNLQYDLFHFWPLL